MTDVFDDTTACVAGWAASDRMGVARSRWDAVTSTESSGDFAHPIEASNMMMQRRVEAIIQRCLDPVSAVNLYPTRSTCPLVIVNLVIRKRWSREISPSSAVVMKHCSY